MMITHVICTFMQASAHVAACNVLFGGGGGGGSSLIQINAPQLDEAPSSSSIITIRLDYTISTT
jgi:hypothetical protein